MRRSALVLTLIASLGAVATATAKDWPAVNGWSFIEEDQYCGMWTDYAGGGATRVAVALTRDGVTMLTIANDNWSTVYDRIYEDIEYDLTTASYPIGKSVGIRLDGKKGVTTKFGDDFLPAFAASTSLKITKGGKLVDQLSLTGSAAAVVQLRKCVAHMRALRAAEERDKARLADIPADPFADDEPVTVPASAPVAWLRRPSDGDIVRNYPSRAARMGIDGSATIRCRVSARGLLQDCAVVAETPDDQGFGASALKMSKLYKMRPQDAAREQSVDIPISFILPKG